MGAHRKPEQMMFLLAAAVLANGAAGLLYVWSLFILPIETALSLDRAHLGLVSSLALICFTLGVSVMPAILARTGRISVAILAFALIAGGHISFGLFPSWFALVLGYGLAFGTGSGIAYGFALSLSASLPERVRAVSIGLALGAFALSGIILPVVLGSWVSTTDPSVAFRWIGLFTLVAGGLCVALLAKDRTNGRTGGEIQSAPPAMALDKPFLILFVIFFLICFTGLAVVSQAAAIAAAGGITTAGYAATTLTLGYLGGSLIGAPLSERMGERAILLLLGILSLMGALTLLSLSSFVLFLGAGLVGLTFGGAGSIMPVLLGMRYGAYNISRLYGRMIIAYGLAGLTAPALAGLLFEHAQSYTPLLGLCAAMATFAIIASLVLERPSQSGWAGGGHL